MVKRLLDVDWGLPKAILSDRDPKWLAELWQALFAEHGCKLLYSTAYNPQTGGASERTNQTVESALRYYLHAIEDPSLWPTILPRMQFGLNNSVSASTTQSPNEVVYGFSLNDAVDLLA